MSNVFRNFCVVMVVVLCLTGVYGITESRGSGGGNSRFKDNGNGTVTDTNTNLMWVKDPSQFGEVTWWEASNKCSSLRISNIGGWRLPSKDELDALYYALQEGHPFTGNLKCYWSSNKKQADNSFQDEAWMLCIPNYLGIYLLTHARDIYMWPVR